MSGDGLTALMKQQTNPAGVRKAMIIVRLMMVKRQFTRNFCAKTNAKAHELYFNGFKTHILQEKLLKKKKYGPFWRVFENLKLAVKQCYQTGQF